MRASCGSSVPRGGGNSGGNPERRARSAPHDEFHQHPHRAGGRLRLPAHRHARSASSGRSSRRSIVMCRAVVAQSKRSGRVAGPSAVEHSSGNHHACQRQGVQILAAPELGGFQRQPVRKWSSNENTIKQGSEPRRRFQANRHPGRKPAPASAASPTEAGKARASARASAAESEWRPCCSLAAGKSICGRAPRSMSSSTAR